jgi:murein DD-endopeptidase MepM/ murein hydrolase activator NlpD
MRACEVAPLARDATGSLRETPTPVEPAIHSLSGRLRDRRYRDIFPGMTDSLVRRRAGRLGIQTPIRPGFALVIGLVLGLGPASAAAATEPGGVWPLTPRPAVVRGFEPPPEPWLPGHRGVDLLGSVGRQVRAASAGTILYAGPLAGRGVVVISHGATRTTYEPLVPSVHAGGTVLAGDPIGTL